MQLKPATLAVMRNSIQQVRDCYLTVLRYFDKQQQIEEMLALLSALGLTVADLDGIPSFLRRAPAPADAAKAGEAEPVAGEGSKH